VDRPFQISSTSEQRFLGDKPVAGAVPRNHHCGVGDELHGEHRRRVVGVLGRVEKKSADGGRFRRAVQKVYEGVLQRCDGETLSPFQEEGVGEGTEGALEARGKAE
jgi:hypothetical protein